MFIERRKLLYDDVRNLCIRANLYTAGTSSDYERLLKSVQNNQENHTSLEDLKKYAQNILEHSDNTNWDLREIIEALASMTYTFVEEFELKITR